ncbi:MAG: hypothetical protein ACON39_03725 [Coraliomargaritaceae bacterium]
MLYVTSSHYRQPGKGTSNATPLECSVHQRTLAAPLRPSKRTLRALAYFHSLTRFKRTP